MNLTPTGFWIVVAILCCAALAVVTAEILRDRDENALDPQPPELDSSRCQIGDCHEPAWSVYDRHPSGWIYVCRSHDAIVQEWAGPHRVRSIEAPFDQEAS